MGSCIIFTTPTKSGSCVIILKKQQWSKWFIANNCILDIWTKLLKQDDYFWGKYNSSWPSYVIGKNFLKLEPKQTF